MKTWLVLSGAAIGAAGSLILLSSRSAKAEDGLTLIGKVEGKAPNSTNRLAFNFYDGSGNQVHRVVADAKVQDGVYAAHIPLAGLEAGKNYSVLVTLPSKVAPARAPQIATPLVMLQASTPGVQQVGNINIDGKLIVGEAVEATSTEGPAVSGWATQIDTTAGLFYAPYGENSVGLAGIGGYGVQAFGGTWKDALFARAGDGSGWEPGFVRAAVVGDGSVHGVAGKTTDASGVGVIGNNFANRNLLSYFFGTAISGVSYGTGRGIVGSSDADHWGVVGTNDYGIEGHFNAGSGILNHGYLGGNSNGAQGLANITNGNGIVGICNNGSAAYGVWGLSSTGYAGVFSGTTWVNGSFFATSKSFRIDHPKDPLNKYLIHSCVESDERLNVYRGTIQCDARGEAWVELPDYFSALNASPSYQLTCIGGYSNVYIATEGVNRFKIGGGKPGLRVSWLVQGVRQDPYAKAHPMIVEPEKPEGERGLLQDPKEHGYPESMGITYEKEKVLQDQEHPSESGMRIVRTASSK
ncbi:MAG TPA: hypothetical protein PLL78_12250 [Fimbriimonadaceae bacterium]|nr:hypothetical protein [Fimbriimonadaceae bacterium]HRJ97447.1 hypothetical protein [Fimbriimonadaceae bacterium]